MRSSSNVMGRFNKRTLVAMYCSKEVFFFSSGTNRERNSVFTNAVENFDQRSGQSGGSVTNRSYSSFLPE